MLDIIENILKSALEAILQSRKPQETPAPIIQPKVEAPKKQEFVKGLDWYPTAIRPVGSDGKKLRMKTRGVYAGGYCEGAIVHFTSGRYEGGVTKAISTIQGGIKNGYAFVCIGIDGSLVQAHPISEWGYHAGESAWKILGSSVSRKTIGIEMNNAGKVKKISDDKFETWFGTYLTKAEVRYVEEKEWGCPTGYYHKYTEKQEKTLIDFLVFLKRNDKTGNFKVENILGHHEVSGKLGIGYWRKNDPGGSLSVPMKKLRQIVEQKLAEV